jgi:ribonuclease J
VPEAIVLRNGQALRLAPGRPEVIAEVPSGRLAVDGKSLVSPQGPLMRARRRLGHNGTVMASLMLGPDDALLAPPALSLSGVAEGEEGPLAGQVAAAVAADFAKLTRRMRRDDRAIEDATRQVIAKTLRDAVGRRPVIGVHILRSPRLDSLAAARPDYDEREVVA